MFNSVKVSSAATILIMVFVLSLAGTAAAKVCPEGDLDGGCEVDWEDVRLFCLQWLESRVPAIEAEEYSSKTAGSGAAAGSSWVDLTGNGSSGDGYVHALPDIGLAIDTNIEAESPHMSYDVDFPAAGTYYLWLKGQSDDFFSQFVHYGLDGSATSSGILDAATLSHDETFTWKSLILSGSGRPSVTVGSEGEHTLDIWMREDGAKIDRLLLTDDIDYLPEYSEDLTADFTGDYRVDFFDYAVLAKDWLVEGCIPVENECTNWQTLHPEWIFCDDFESSAPMVAQGRYFEYNKDDGDWWDSPTGDFIPMDGVGYNGSRGMRVLFQAEGGDDRDQTAGNLKLAFGRVPSGSMDKGIRNTEDFREVYYRMYLKMQEGWVGNPAKLSRATILAESDWSQAMIAHIWNGGAYSLGIDPVRCIDTNNEVKCIGYNDFDNMDWIGQQDGITPIFDSLHDGIWYCIEAHVKLNDPGLSNGVQEFWIDGQLETRGDGKNFVRSYTDYGINAIFFENYWNSRTPVTQERYFDSIVVSTERIGCDCE